MDTTPLKYELRELEEIRDNYFSLRAQNKEADKTLSCYNTLAAYQNPNLYNVTKQRILVRKKFEHLKSTESELKYVCNCLHVCPNEASKARDEHYQQIATRMKKDLMDKLHEEEKLATRLTELKAKKRDIQRAVAKYKNPDLTHYYNRCEHPLEITDELCHFPGIARMYEHLKNTVMDAACVFERVTRNEVYAEIRNEEKTIRRKYEIMQLPDMRWKP